MGKAESDRISIMKQVAADILQFYCSQEGYGSNLEAVSIKKKKNPTMNSIQTHPTARKANVKMRDK